jgi:hypothetical protein
VYTIPVKNNYCIPTFGPPYRITSDNDTLKLIAKEKQDNRRLFSEMFANCPLNFVPCCDSWNLSEKEYSCNRRVRVKHAVNKIEPMCRIFFCI